MQTADASSPNSAIASTKVKPMIFGYDLHSWEHAMLLSLLGAGAVAIAVFIATASVVILTRRENAETKAEYAAYKLTVDGKVADAKNEGLKAGKDAGSALLRAAELEKQAEELRKATAEADARAAQATQKAVEAQLALEKFKQPRLLQETRIQSIAEKLAKFAGMRFDAAVVPGDPEAIIFLSHLTTVLEVAKWTWVPWAPPGGAFQMIYTIGDKPNIGQLGWFNVLLLIHPDHASSLSEPTEALVAAIKAEGFEAAYEIVDNPSAQNKDTIHVVVGRKR